MPRNLIRGVNQVTSLAARELVTMFSWDRTPNVFVVIAESSSTPLLSAVYQAT